MYEVQDAVKNTAIDNIVLTSYTTQARANGGHRCCDAGTSHRLQGDCSPSLGKSKGIRGCRRHLWLYGLNIAQSSAPRHHSTLTKKVPGNSGQSLSLVHTRRLAGTLWW